MINAKPRLRIGIPGDYLPFGIIDEGSQAGFAGHDIDLMEGLCREAGLAPQFILTSWPALFEELSAGRFDVAAGGVSWLPERARRFDDLPRYAPFAKVALIRKSDEKRFLVPEDLNQPSVRVIKNPGGTNEVFVNTHLKRASVATVADNASIPARIASEVGDVMITDSFEARWYSARDVRLTPAFGGKGLTPESWKTILVRRGVRKPQLPGRESLPGELLITSLLSAWGRLERAGFLAELSHKWLGS